MIISQSCLTPFQILSSTLWVRNCPLFWYASSFLKIKDCHSSRVCFAVVVVSTTSSWDDKDGAERRTCFFFRFSDGRTCHQEQHNFSIILKRLNFYSFLLRTDCTRVLVSPKDNHRRAKQQPHPYTQKIYSSITFFFSDWLDWLYWHDIFGYPWLPGKFFYTGKIFFQGSFKRKHCLPKKTKQKNLLIYISPIEINKKLNVVNYR